MKHLKIAAFVTPHGLGHAARASAILRALQRVRREVEIHLFTSVPQWFFEQSLDPFNYHHTVVDVGLVQLSPTKEDLGATVERLAALPLEGELFDELVRAIGKLKPDLVLCDIAPMGIAVAQRAGLRCVLIENFTWDWIYEGYRSTEPRLNPFIQRFADLFASVDMHIQCEPVCCPSTSAVTVPPVSRPPRVDRKGTRDALAIGDEPKVVLLTMGGVRCDYRFLDALAAYPEVHFLVSALESGSSHPKNVRILTPSDQLYHPDLVAMSDLLIGKVGYSTVAEVWSAGVPFAYIPRPGFREGPVLVDFIERALSAVSLEDEAFYSGAWVERLTQYLQLHPVPPPRERGAEEAAAAILQIL
jgi:UDP:flavonoid glycosyltransferase YjiC (YdhE family)